MDCNTETIGWRKEFVASIMVTLKDSRLWLIVLPALVLCGLALVLLKPWLGGTVSFAVGLVASRLIKNFETLPRPDERELVGSIYRGVVRPAAVGILIIPSSDLFVRLWFAPWHWFHAIGATLPCSYILTGGLLGWLGAVVTPVVIALIAKERAVFATVIGLIVYLPLTMTESFSGSGALSTALLFAKSCHMDFDPSTDVNSLVAGYGAGMVTGMLVQALMAIFIAKFVSTWISRKSLAIGKVLMS